MNKHICLQAICLIACYGFMPQQAAAQQLTIHGKFDCGTYSVQGYTSAAATVKSSATLATAHTDGLSSSLSGFGTYLLDSGVNYIFNGATETPFPAQANAGAAAIYAGKLTINAATSINKTLYVADTLTLNTGHLTIPPADSLVITSGLAIAGGPFSQSKHIVTAVDLNNNQQGRLQVRPINSVYLFPVGTGAYYLPATVAPVSGSGFVVSAFTGITANGQPGGAAFTAQQLADVVNAVWTVQRTSGNGSCQLTLGWPQALEGSNFIPAQTIGITSYDTAWQDAVGSGDNTINSANKNFTYSSIFGVAMKACPVEGQSGKIASLMNRIWPNPATDQLMITHSLSGSRISISLYDLSGRMLRREYANSRNVLMKLTTLRPGMYMVAISDGTTTVTQRFLKQ